MQKEKGLIWFTNNLRAIDNKVLYEASKRSDSLIGYYNFDPLLFKRNIWGFKKTEKYRTKFLIESIDNLKKNLSQLNITLVIDFSEGFNKLFEVIGREKISSIYFQKEWTSEEKETQDKDEIKQVIKKMEILKNNLGGPNIKELINKLEKNPNNISLVIEVADKYFSIQEYESSMD